MEVQVIRWPSERAKRRQYHRDGVPRLLVVEGSTPPPLCIDVLEDWIRPPAHRAEILARKATLRSRARRVRLPNIDLNDVLCYEDRQLALSSAEVPVMQVLVAAFGAVVPRDVLIERGWPNEDTPRPNTLDRRILRLRKRIEPVRLAIRTVWGHGYMLEPVDR